MKKALRQTIAVVCALAVIFLLVNVRLGFIYKQPDRLQVTFKEPATIEQILKSTPALKLVDPEKTIFSMSKSTMNITIQKIERIPGVQKVQIIPENPEFSWNLYTFGMKEILKNYVKGDFGEMVSSTGFAKSLVSQIGSMFLRTSTYFFAALGVAIVIGLLLPVLASKFRICGRVFDGIHRMLLTLPDFLVVVLITYFAIFISKFTTQRLILIMQLNNEVPFLIPFLTIALIPSVMIYGTIRDALRREMGRPYIATALAKGMSKTRIIITHAMRNVMEDFFAVLPRVTTAAVSSMIVAEATCSIFGLGGFVASPFRSSPGALAFICMQLALFAFLMHGIYALLRKWLIVSTKEAEV